jgi:hypothetical protein
MKIITQFCHLILIPKQSKRRPRRVTKGLVAARNQPETLVYTSAFCLPEIGVSLIEEKRNICYPRVFLLSGLRT